jgi:DNA-binding transcriptional ArsR family regulator
MLEFEPTIPQRRRFGLFLLSSYRELRIVYPGGFESFLVATCAAMGNRHSGKPVNVSSIAEMTGIPRPTVIRKLRLLEEIGLASRSETRHGTMVYMSPESWDHVRPHVARLLELEIELATASENSRDCITGAVPARRPDREPSRVVRRT